MEEAIEPVVTVGLPVPAPREDNVPCEVPRDVVDFFDPTLCSGNRISSHLTLHQESFSLASVASLR